MKLMFKLIMYAKSNVIYFIITSLLMSGCLAIAPLLMKYLVDDVATSNDIHLLIKTLSFIILFMIVQTILFFFNGVQSVKVVKKIDASLRKNLITSIVNSNHKFFAENNQSYLQNVLQRDTHVIASFINRKIVPIISQMIIFIVILIVMLNLNLLLALICVFFLPVYYLIFNYTGKRLEAYVPDFYRIYDGLTSSMLRILGGFEVIKAYRKEKDEVSSYSDWTDQYYNNEIKMTSIENASSTISFLFGSVLSLGLFGFAIYLIMIGKTTLGTAVAFSSYMGKLFDPVQTISGIQTDVARIKQAFTRVKNVLAGKQEDLKNFIDVPKLNSVNFIDVHFSYHNNRPVLNGLSLKFRKGEIYAFVGDSGAGKSTLAKLIMKFYTPESGKIMINDIDYQTISDASVRKLFAYIPQDCHLLSGSILENITYGTDNVSQCEVLDLIDKLKLTNFVASLPKGLNTIIDELGSNLSGGEKQRIAIGRAILSKADCIIADEMSGNLDLHTEAAVMNTMFEAVKNKTTLVIAHRLQTVVKADTIFVMRKGKIVEKGTHAELLENNSYYKKLWDRQKTNPNF